MTENPGSDFARFALDQHALGHITASFLHGEDYFGMAANRLSARRCRGGAKHL